MAFPKYKQLPEDTNFANLWENEYKPLILSYYQVPLDIVAKVFGASVTKIQEQLRSGLYDYGVARPNSGGQFSYEVYPLRLIAFVEGTMAQTRKTAYATTSSKT